MGYRVVFDVADRMPDIALGVIAGVLLVGVILTGLVAFDQLLPRWPVVLAAGAGIVILETLVDSQPAFLVGTTLIALFTVVAERYAVSPEQPTRRRRTPAGGSGIAVGLFMLVFAAGRGLAMIPAIDLARQLGDGRAVVLEGPVGLDDFGKSECISVVGRRFCYSNWELTPGFSQVRGLGGIGGPMRDGLQVRLSVIGDTIVRVEVAETSAPSGFDRVRHRGVSTAKG